jgi:LacI family transcriptional regulator
MRRNQKAITIQDVAKAAGVSISTVSRVLNDKDDVAASTYEHVQEIIQELGYTSNLAARSMRSHKKNLIGLVVPDIGFPYSIEIMKGVNRAVAGSSFDLLVYTTGEIYKEGTVSREQYYVSLLNNSLTDGVIIVASAAAEFVTDAPIIAVDPHLVNPNYPSVQGTNYKGAVEAVEHLLSLGHTRIAFICGRPEIGSAIKRLNGYKDSLTQAGVEISEDLIIPGDFSTESGYSAARKLLSYEDPPTAIFASNDQTALGVFQAAEELGVGIPDDLSLVGFDNISEARSLGLTTIDQKLPDMGYTAVQMLFKLIAGERLKSEIYRMETNLIERSSTRSLKLTSPQERLKTKEVQLDQKNA